MSPVRISLAARLCRAIPFIFVPVLCSAQDLATTPPADTVAMEDLPFFITGPAQTDILFNITIVFLLAVVMALGNLYFQLHALPERMAHRASRVQLEIVAVLCLIALFTHNHIYWILGLLLALVQLPDFSTPVAS